MKARNLKPERRQLYKQLTARLRMSRRTAEHGRLYEDRIRAAERVRMLELMTTLIRTMK